MEIKLKRNYILLQDLFAMNECSESQALSKKTRSKNRKKTLRRTVTKEEMYEKLNIRNIWRENIIATLGGNALSDRSFNFHFLPRRSEANHVKCQGQCSYQRRDWCWTMVPGIAAHDVPLEIWKFFLTNWKQFLKLLFRANNVERSDGVSVFLPIIQSIDYASFCWYWSFGISTTIRCPLSNM